MLSFLRFPTRMGPNGAAYPAGRLHDRWGRGCSGVAVASFDHLVGAGEQRRRDGEADRFGSCHVDNKLHLGRKLYWQIARLFPFQNPVHEVGTAAVVLAQLDAIAHQTAILDVLTEIKDRGMQLTPGSTSCSAARRLRSCRLLKA